MLKNSRTKNYLFSCHNRSHWNSYAEKSSLQSLRTGDDHSLGGGKAFMRAFMKAFAMGTVAVDENACISLPDPQEESKLQAIIFQI